MKKLTLLGIGLSALWLLGFGLIICLKVEDARTMTLNEWGDFVAGSSSVPALLWLVIGYFQHGQELRLNTKALKLQQKELRFQAEETARLAKNAERQAKAAESLTQLTKSDREREAAPQFAPQGGTGRLPLKTQVKNRGGDASDITIVYSGPHRLEFSTTRLFEADALATLLLWPHGILEYPIHFEIHCTDELDHRHSIKFEMTEQHDFREINRERDKGQSVD